MIVLSPVVGPSIQGLRTRFWVLRNISQPVSTPHGGDRTLAALPGKLRHMSSFPPSYLPPLPSKGSGDQRAYLRGRWAPLPSSLHPELALGLQALAPVPSPLLSWASLPGLNPSQARGGAHRDLGCPPTPLCPAGTPSRGNQQLILTMKRGEIHISPFFTSITEQLKILEAVSI